MEQKHNSSGSFKPSKYKASPYSSTLQVPSLPCIVQVPLAESQAAAACRSWNRLPLTIWCNTKETRCVNCPFSWRLCARSALVLLPTKQSALPVQYKALSRSLVEHLIKGTAGEPATACRHQHPARSTHVPLLELLTLRSKWCTALRSVWASVHVHRTAACATAHGGQGQQLVHVCHSVSVCTGS